jgi:3D (Asp-Asp-Asp) domain-containing protein
MEVTRFIPVAITAYNPISKQTDSTPEITASNKLVSEGMIALSRDLEEEFEFIFGDTVVIEGFGRFNFEDRMSKRWTRRVDILMLSNEAAKRFGVQHSFLVMRY